MITTLTIYSAISIASDEFISHVMSNPAEEMVGLVLSDGGVVRLTNQARSATRFAIGQGQMAEALARIDPEEKTVIAIYHSHPTGDLFPSRTDVDSIRGQWDQGINLAWVIVDPIFPDYETWIMRDGEPCQLN